LTITLFAVLHVSDWWRFLRRTMGNSTDEHNLK